MDTQHQRHFSFMRPEVEFYKNHKMPFPNEHHIYRMFDLLAYSNTAQFKQGTCEKCAKPIEYGHNRKFSQRHLYCRECYLQHLEKTN